MREYFILTATFTAPFALLGLLNAIPDILSFLRSAFRALSDKSDPSGKSDKALSAALESWLGPMADQIADAAALSDEELDKKLRSGIIAKPGDSSGIEAVMTEDMRSQYGN